MSNTPLNTSQARPSIVPLEGTVKALRQSDGWIGRAAEYGHLAAIVALALIDIILVLGPACQFWAPLQQILA